MDLAFALALWLHTVGLVIAVGYYGILGRVLIPSLERSLHGHDLADAIVHVESRALPIVVLSILMFAVSGTYLLLVNPAYAGLGHFFDNTWSTLMLVKHGIIVAIVGLGALVDWTARQLDLADNEAALHSAIRRVRLSAEATTGLGVIAILLTALAQASQ